MQIDEALDGAEQPVLQPGLVRAAHQRGDQVDIALAQRGTVFGEGHAPGGALAFGEVLGFVAGGVLLAFEQRDQRLGGQVLVQVVAQAALVEPGLRLVAFLMRQRHRHTGHQHCLAAQQVHQLVLRQLGAVEVAGIGPDAHAGALLAFAARGLAQCQRLDHVAAAEGQRRHLAVAPHRHLQPLGQRIGDADTHAVQTAGEAVGPTRALVELAARMQPREDDLDDRHLLFGVQAKRDAAAVVVDADRAIGMQRQCDALAEAGQGLVGGVVDHFLDHVQRVVGARVHARPLLDGLQALEHADRGFCVSALLGRHGGGL